MARILGLLFYFVVVDVIEAIEAIVDNSESSEGLLNSREKITKGILFAYLTYEGVVFEKRGTKSDFVENTLTRWRKQTVCCLYSAASSPLDHSNRFTLYPPAYLFIPTPTRLLREPC